MMRKTKPRYTAQEYQTLRHEVEEYLESEYGFCPHILQIFDTEERIKDKFPNLELELVDRLAKDYRHG